MKDYYTKFKHELMTSFNASEKTRFKYVKHKHQHPHSHPECKFCERIRLKKGIFFENHHLVVMFGRPHHKGHLVVMPKIHEEDLMKLHEKTLDSFMNDTVKIMKALGNAIKPDLFNLEYLDNWDHHLHWNVYPRFKTDADWGNPPVIPLKGEKFEEKLLSTKELAVFKREIKKMSKELW